MNKPVNLSLPVDLIIEAKVYCLHNDIKLSHLVEELLSQHLKNVKHESNGTNNK